MQQGEVIADGSCEQIELRLSGLIVEHQGKLKVYNQIYQSVFNQNWVENALANLRPYSKAFSAWLASNYQDESQLLRGQALQEALTWAAEKSLSDRDYQFLAACQKLDKRVIERVLVAEKRALVAEKEEITSILAEAQRKARRRVYISSGVLLAALLGASISSLIAVRNIQSAREAEMELKKVQQKAQQFNLKLQQAEMEFKKAQQKARQSELKLQQAQMELKKAQQKAQQSQRTD